MPLLSTFGAGSVRGFRPGLLSLPIPTAIDLVMSSGGGTYDNSSNTPYYAFGGNAGSVYSASNVSLSLAGTNIITVGGAGGGSSFSTSAGIAASISPPTSSQTLKQDASPVFYSRGADGMQGVDPYYPYNPGGAASSGGSGTNGGLWSPGTSGSSVPTSFTPSSISPVITVGGVGGAALGYVFDTSTFAYYWTSGNTGTKYTSSGAGNGVAYYRTGGQNWSSSTATNGVVAFSHPKTFKQGVITGSNNSVSISGNYYVYVFNSSGTVTW